MNYDSIYKKYSNITLDWCPMDTNALYLKNLKDRYDDLKKFNWINNTVSYTFNEHGFRCSDFENKPSILFLGCSYTMGIGINIEDTWSYIVAKNLNLHYVNLGQGGGSNDTAFRLAYHWIPQIKPKIVFLLRPDSSRVEIISKFGGIKFLLPNSGHDHNLWYKDWLLEDTNSYINIQKNTFAISEICKRENVKFQYLDAATFAGNTVDFARDLSHPGILSNKMLVSKILSIL